MIKEIQKAKDIPYLILDGGALLFDNDRLFPGRQEQALVTAQGIVEAYNLMNYTAVGIAPEDLAGGLDFLAAIREKSKFAWLSANIVRKSTGKAIFPASTLTKIGDLTVGIIGITGKIPFYTFTEKDDAHVIPWLHVLPGLVKELSKKSDLIVLLSSLDARQNDEIAKKFTDIHIIIQAMHHSSNKYPKQVDNTVLCQVLKQGKYMGVLEFNWSPSSVWGHNRNTLLIQKQREFERYDWEIKRYTQIKKTDAKQLEVFNDLVRRRDEAGKELKKIEDAIEQERDKRIISATFKNQFIALEKTLPDQKDVLAIVEDVKKKVNELGRKRALQNKNKKILPTFGKGINLVGNKACASCHKDQSASWKKTRHAKAFITLLVRQQQYNMKCIPCHVTGVETGDEPYAYSLPEALHHVGCEVCHSPGKKHATDPKNHKLPKRPAPEICQRCHTPERDDTFDYQKDLKLVTH